MRKIDEVWNEIKPILEKHFQDDSTKKEEQIIPTIAEVSISCDGFVTTNLSIDKRTVLDNLGATIILEPKIPNTIQVGREQLANVWDESYRIRNLFADSSKSETFKDICKALGFEDDHK